MRTIEEVKRERDDLSTFLVHLTRDTEDGNTAQTNLMSILDQQKIEARNPKGLCYNWDKFKNFTQSVCFTETPLNYLRYLFDITGRGINLKPYGLVFTKAFLQEKGANPVFYINTYNGDGLKKAICRIINNHPTEADVQEIVAYIDIFGKAAGNSQYDFYWEREWRVRGDLCFNLSDVIIGLCEEPNLGIFDKKYPSIKFISSNMSMEEIIQKIIRK